MKKTTLLLTFILCLLLSACGGKTTTTDSEANTSNNSSSVYKLGDIIETDLFKITPSFTGYAYELANWPDKDFMTPAGQFSGESPYSASDGKTEMYGEIQIEYVGNEKSNVSLTIGVSANYDDGYIFEDAYVHLGTCISPDGDWKYEGSAIFEPLSNSTTRLMRYCIEVPEQVETNADKSLLVTFSVNGEKFVYDFRSGDVLGSDYDPRGELYQSVDENTKQEIIKYLKKNGLVEMGWYDKTVGEFTFTFGDNTVSAILPIYDSDYQYEFNGTYEIFSGTILLSWDYGAEMHLDYTFDGKELNIIEFEHDR